MKIGLVIVAAAMLALPVHAQKPDQTKPEQSKSEKAQEAKVAQLEIQLARYREATDKLLATLTEANEELTVRVKALSKERAEMAIRIARLEVRLGEKSARPRNGLLYQGEYQRAVEILARSVASMRGADSVEEATKLTDGALREIAAIREAIQSHRRR